MQSNYKNYLYDLFVRLPNPLLGFILVGSVLNDFFKARE